jgi:hypothetical protein
MIRPLPGSASITFFYITDQRSTDRTPAEKASCTPTSTGVSFTFQTKRARANGR